MLGSKQIWVIELILNRMLQFGKIWIHSVLSRVLLAINNLKKGDGINWQVKIYSKLKVKKGNSSFQSIQKYNN